MLRAARDGDERAREDLMARVYEPLKAIARQRLGPGGRSVTLDTRALVHEAYLRLFKTVSPDWQDRGHFYSVASVAMRQIVVDHARKRATAKRGGGQTPIELDATCIPVDDHAEDILALDQALSRLAGIDPRLARIVELRYFGGLSVEEVARVLDVSEPTVKRDWRKARALLFHALKGGGS
jgi:RNA polymerase sigma factor (TIGR02999 family)